MICPRSLRLHAQQSLSFARAFAFALVPICLSAAPALAQTAPDEVVINFDGNRALEVIGVITMAIRDNSIAETDVNRATVLDTSVVANRGIVQLNQDAGAASNQANLVLLAYGEGDGNAFQSTSIFVRQDLTNNTVVIHGGTRSNTIQNSFTDTTGIVQVNQNSGVLNQQLNVAALNIGSFTGTSFVSVTDTALGRVAAGNNLTFDGTSTRSDVIDGSFSGFRGVAQVTQMSGDGNAVTNATIIGVTVLNVR